MKKDVRIDGRMQRVFVLAEESERLVYIPVKSLDKIHYDQLTEISEANPKNMLTEMSKTKLPNGRNALAVFDSLIQVMVKSSDTEGERLRKPDEAVVDVQLKGDAKPEVHVQETQAPAPQAQKAPTRRKPGPKPKPKQ
jgi:hypothetical protein